MKKILFIFLAVVMSQAIQSQGIYNNGARIVSESGSYWVVDGGSFTLTSESANNLATMGNLKIFDAGASLTITPRSCLTVSGTLTNNGTGGIVIQSDSHSTGSLITGTAGGTGSATAQRWMTAGSWHIISSPLSGQTIGVAAGSFLKSNANIATNGLLRGMMDYNPAGNSWNGFFTDEKTGNLETGQGFSMRLQMSTPLNHLTDDATVSFTGSLQTGALSASGLTKAKWNCIGNPYTSAIGITTTSNSTDHFLFANTDNLDPLYGAIYVWNKPDDSNGQTGSYTTISNNSPEFVDVQQGQAFMVNMKAGVTAVSFTSGMQFHSPALVLKSAKEEWPVIKLKATVGEQISKTIIAFNSGMTKGLDPTYDAGLLKGGTDLLVYSRLVEDNGIPFAIQALPDNDYSNMIIPIGLDFKTGGEVVFSAETSSLSADCKVILEDKLTKTFTDLSTNVYKTAIAANSVITDRFNLHTSYLTTGSNLTETFAGKLSAYAVRNVEIRIKGEVSKQAVATLYDIQGRVVLVKNLEGGRLNIIPTPNIRSGIYMLFVKDNEQMQGFKIPVTE